MVSSQWLHTGLRVWWIVIDPCILLDASHHLKCNQSIILPILHALPHESSHLFRVLVHECTHLPLTNHACWGLRNTPKCCKQGLLIPHPDMMIPRTDTQTAYGTHPPPWCPKCISDKPCLPEVVSGFAICPFQPSNDVHQYATALVASPAQTEYHQCALYIGACLQDNHASTSRFGGGVSTANQLL